jgi:hypothetical protein
VGGLRDQVGRRPAAAVTGLQNPGVYRAGGGLDLSVADDGDGELAEALVVMPERQRVARALMQGLGVAIG